MPAAAPLPASASRERRTVVLRRRWWVALFVLNAVLWLGVGQAVVWGPLWWHWRVQPPEVAQQAVEANRRQPDDRVLEVVAETSMTTDHPLRGEAAVAAADRLLAGELVLPKLPVVPIDPGFSPRDLSQGVPVQQIFTGSLIVPDLLLRAHEHKPNPAYVAAALRYVRGFVEFEAAVQWPVGYERNSHAVANRASVLARLWRHVRQAADYEPDTGRLVHLHAQRVAALLAKPSNFIASTNHGVMQNIGLLQLAAAFPALPDAAGLRRLALSRLALQLPGWVDRDGVVLEHSAGYHFHGTVLTGYVVKLLEIVGEPVPREWAAAHQRALDVMATLQRPDRSLPAYGNTFRYAWQLPAVLGVDEGEWERRLRERDSFARLFGVAGHAVWWSAGSAAGVATHTHVPWGYFAGHGHRRAQEMSLLIWAVGTDWSTNTGYWPSEDTAGIWLTDGWVGSNAPHVLGEAADASRQSRLLMHAEAAGLRFIDLEREVSPGASAPSAPSSVRRQILQWQGSTWVTLDTYADPLQRELRVLWTSAPETTQRRIGERAFRVEAEGSPLAMTLAVEGSAGVTASSLRGSREPFGGWVAFDRRAWPAPAVDARLPSSTGWMLSTVDLRPGTTGASAREAPKPGLATKATKATMVAYADPEDWTFRIQAGDGRPSETVEVTRKRGSLSVQTTASKSHSLRLTPGPGEETALKAIAASRAALLEAYPRYRVDEWSRRRWSNLLLVGWLVSTVGLGAIAFVMARRRGRIPSAPV